MNYKDIKDDDDFPLSNSQELRKAKLGTYHIGFIKNNFSKVMSIDDKKSIEAAVDFYNLMIKRGFKAYPISTAKSYKLIDINNKKVLREIIGLPECFSNEIDFNKNILNQINFEDNLSDVKKYTYRHVFDFFKKKWYSDVFKNYCLEQGVFFLYDETIPFINNENNYLPVLIDETKISNKIKTLLKEATSIKLILECLDKDISEDEIEEFKKYDSISFIDRVDYFINDIYVKKIANLKPNNSFKELYSRCLRIYLAFIVNYLYDKFLFDVIKNISYKKSVFSESKIGDYYVMSNINAEMYSKDKINYFFTTNDFSRISVLYNKYKELKNPLLIYKAMKLPWIGYKEFLKAYGRDSNEPYKHLKYSKEVSYLDMFLSTKRGDQFYNYDANFIDKTHNEIFIHRNLILEGFLYHKITDNYKDEEKIDIEIINGLDNSLLDKKFTKGKKRFYKYFFRWYEMLYGTTESKDLSFYIKKLDKSSKKEAVGFFIKNIHNRSLKDTIKLLETTYDVYLDYDMYANFFNFILNYPKFYVQNEINQILILNENEYAKNAFYYPYSNNEDYEKETYEISLPYKFVSYGEYFYSFKKSYTSTPYICSCQKEAVEKAVNHFTSIYNKWKENNKDIAEELPLNSYLTIVLGLPNDIVKLIDNKKPLFSQLKFKDKLCHLCNHAEPLYSDQKNNDFDLYNSSAIYKTYITALGAKHDIFVSEDVDSYKVDSIFSHIDNIEDFFSLLSKQLSYKFKNSIPNVLSPYFDIDGVELALLLASTILTNFENPIYFLDLANLVTLKREDVKKYLLNDSQYMSSQPINISKETYSKIFFIYNLIMTAYRNEIARKELNLYEDYLCLNIDYVHSLPYPYVFLGKNFNAYSSSEDGKDIYLCSCDKKGVTLVIKMLTKMFKDTALDNTNLKTIAVLSLSGLPYAYVKNYVHFKDPLTALANFKYKNSICRKCQNINHAAFHLPFMKIYPNKDELDAEYSFCKSKLASEGITFIDFIDLNEIHYDPNYNFNLKSAYSPLLPSILIQNLEDNTVSDALYKYTVVPEKQFENYLYDYSLLSKISKEEQTKSINFITTVYKKNNKAIYQTIKYLGYQREKIIDVINSFFKLDKNDEYFKRFKHELRPFYPNNQLTLDNTFSYDSFYQFLLGFIVYILEGFFKKYALDEKRIGK